MKKAKSKRVEVDPLDIPDYLKVSAAERMLAWQTETDFLRRMAAQGKERRVDPGPDRAIAIKPTGTTKRSEDVMKTKSKKAVRERQTDGEGLYKGHRADSRIGRMHKCFDEKGKAAAGKLGEKLQLTPLTIADQLSRFARVAKPAKVAKSARVAAKAPKAKAKKAKARKAPVERHVEREDEVEEEYAVG